MQIRITSEAGRRGFLKEQCYLVFEVTTSREEAEEREKIRELDGRSRYVGNVCKR